MADDIDRGCELEEKYRVAALSVRKPEGPASTGECLWCGEAIEAPRRWCNAECRDSWAKLSKTGGFEQLKSTG